MNYLAKEIIKQVIYFHITFTTLPPGPVCHIKNDLKKLSRYIVIG